MSVIRLFVNEEILQENQTINIAGSDHDYLTKVMRRKIGDEITIFNGKDGEFLAQINNLSKKNSDLLIKKKTANLDKSSKITLAFAPVKNVRIDFVAAKATEMGVAKFQPIITKHTIVKKINEKRFFANCKEACEQCQRNDMPKIEPILKLENFLKEVNKNQILILCDESKISSQAIKDLAEIFKQEDNYQEIIIFIGPEGGFSREEFDKFYKIENLHNISLGPRILRADTAIISALALVGQFIN